MLDALKSIGDSKAPGVDGFSAKFCKFSWKIIGEDIFGGVSDFFQDWKIVEEC